MKKWKKTLKWLEERRKKKEGKKKVKRLEEKRKQKKLKQKNDERKEWKCIKLKKYMFLTCIKCLTSVLKHVLKTMFTTW